MRYWAGPRKIMEVLQGGEIGRPLSFTYHFGQYLPDWHPWERIQDYYVSKRETGAAREIVAFELAWLMEAFGRPKRVWGAKGRLGDLDVDIDDTYQVLLDHGGVLGHMLIEVNARAALRLFRVVATEDTIEWDHVANEVRVYRAATKAWETVSLVAGNVEPGYMHAEDYYIEEMRDFVAAVRRERPFPHDYAAEVRLQQVVLAVEDSAAGGVEVP
ncbi:MAG: hypothetical protein EPN20_06220 [Magnetospirillum sp.]|nr:MAG: hypothetical protein EPN20_06220 [Magnetospirillum sp.]